MHPDSERHARSVLPSLRYSWAFMLVASLAWTGLGVLASPVASPPGATTATPITAAITALGVLCAAATIWLDRAFFRPARIVGLVPIPDNALAQRHLLAGHLALWSLAELPALLGFAQLLLDGPLSTHLALCAVSLATLALLMPTRARVTTRLAAALR